MSNPFHFQQFTIVQNMAAMKVGTDGVLLGAWANVESAQTILDIGTGTGLLALMAAQRNAKAKITAIDIDLSAVEQTTENVNASSWSSRITVKHQSIQEFSAGCNMKFDHIVCNPPYFKSTAKFKHENRLLARQQEQFSIQELAECVAVLLSQKGLFTLIYPAEESEHLLEKMQRNHLFASRICWVKPTNTKAPKRILVEFKKQKQPEIKQKELIIEPEQRHQYSKEFIELTKSFYLER